ncbi:hypothetical protein LCGC14_3164770, partial [marine sediment metagenome]
MELVALLSTGKGTWNQISGLINHGEWEKVIILGDEFAKKFSSEKKFEFIKIDLNKKIKEIMGTNIYATLNGEQILKNIVDYIEEIKISK